MAKQELYSLSTSRVSAANFGGLCEESVDIATGQEAYLGDVGIAALNKLRAKCSGYLAQLKRNLKSVDTALLNEAKQKRADLFSDVRRTVKAAAQSISMAATAAAGKRLRHWLEPFWDTDDEPTMTQTTGFNLLKARYAADATLAEAASTLGVADAIAQLFAANDAVDALYTRRSVAQAAEAGPSATSLKGETAEAYNDFCLAVKQRLNNLPSPELQVLFNRLNELRRKYVERERQAKSENAEEGAGR